MPVLASADPFAGMDVTIAPAARDGFTDSFAAAWRQHRIAGQGNSGAIVTRESLDELADSVGAEQGLFDRVRGPALPTNTGHERADRLPGLLARVRAARATDPHAYPGLPDTPEKFDAWVAGKVQRESADLGQELARSDSPAGRLLGGMAAGFTDPVNLLLMPFGAAAGAGVVRTALTEAVLGAGASVAEAPLIADWRGKVGLDYTAKDFFGNLAYGAAGGAVFGAAVKIAPKVARALGRIGDLNGRKLVEEFDASGIRAPEALAARDLVAAAEDTRDTNPFHDIPAAREEHATRLQEAVQAISENRAAATPDRPLMPLADARASAVENLDGPFPPGSAARLERLGTADQLASLKRDALLDAAGEIRAAIGDLDNRMVASGVAMPRRPAQKDVARAKFLRSDAADDLPAELRTILVPQKGPSADHLAGLTARIAQLEDAAAIAARREIELAPAKSEILDHAVRALRRDGVADPHQALWPLVHGEDAIAPSFDQVAAAAGTAAQREAAGADLAAQAKARPREPRPAPQRPVPEKARAGDGGPQSSADARLKTYSDPGAGGQQTQAEQLAIAAAEDLERAPDAPDVTPMDPLTGDAQETRALLEDFKRDQAAVDYLKTCIPGGGA